MTTNPHTNGVAITEGRRPVETMTDRELAEDIHRMLSNLAALVERYGPAVEKVGQDIQQGGLMGLMAGMMGGGRKPSAP